MFNCLQACNAFQGCPHCYHRWQTGYRFGGRRSKPLCNGYRRFLPQRSRWRQRSFRWHGRVYWFKDVEPRRPPKLRTVRTATKCVALAGPRRPVCGHKGMPFRILWHGFRWLLSCCDPMHDYNRAAAPWSSKISSGKGRTVCTNPGIMMGATGLNVASWAGFPKSQTVLRIHCHGV